MLYRLSTSLFDQRYRAYFIFLGEEISAAIFLQKYYKIYTIKYYKKENKVKDFLTYCLKRKKVSFGVLDESIQKIWGFFKIDHIYFSWFLYC